MRLYAIICLIIIGGCGASIFERYDWLGFLEFLLVEFLRRLPHLLALEVLYPELHSSQLYHIKFFYQVVLTHYS